MSVPAAATGLLWAAFRRITAACMPDWADGEREAVNQVRLFLLSHVFGPPLSLGVPLALYAFDPDPGYDVAMLAASIMAFWLFPLALRAGAAYRHLVYGSILNLNFAILWSCYHYGGIHSPTAIWVLIIPILSVFYIGSDSRQKAGLLVANVACLALFAVAYLAFPPAPSDLPAMAVEVLGAISAFSVMAYIAGMAVYYARIVDAGTALENEVARRRLMAVDLRRATEAARQAASARSAFLARMSHELRSPLNAIIGYGELLQEEETADAAMARDVDRIVEAGRYLTRLIDMILDLAKIEAGKMQFDHRPVDLAGLVRTVAATHRAAAAERGTRIETRIETGGAARLDAGRVTQILSILVDNAVRHTETGSIAIALAETRLDGAAAFEIEVADDGEGISAEMLPVIFDTFTTDRPAAQGRYGGTGLALSVARRFCEAMGGTIRAASEPGEGSTFTLRLPAAPAGLAPVADPAPAAADLPVPRLAVGG